LRDYRRNPRRSLRIQQLQQQQQQQSSL
jgi:hypothetical protein